MSVMQVLRAHALKLYRELSTGFHKFLLVALSVAACSASKRSAQADTAQAGASTFRVALLTPGSISDQSWNGGAYRGLLRIRDSLGAKISHIETKTPAEFEENFRQYGNQGYDLVFGHGFEFQEAAKAVAPSYPKTQYVVTSGNTATGNRFRDGVRVRRTILPRRHDRWRHDPFESDRRHWRD